MIRSLFKYLIATTFLFIIIAGIGVWFSVRYANRAHQIETKKAAQNLKRQDVQITIIEGKRREEIAAILAKAAICTSEDFLAASQDKEGYLFPDTYRFFPNTPGLQVVAAMTNNYKIKMASALPTPDQLILASIVEREASNNEQRPVIAGVYTNRLAIEMNLEADPTVQYGKDSNNYTSSTSSTFTFWQPITQNDYRGIKSSYNTYLHGGLPPGPIANPGKASILAAENPTKHDYFYFINKDGQLLLSKTLAEHQSKQ